MLILLLLFFLPAAAVLMEAFRGEDGLFTFGNMLTTITDSYTWRIAAFTLLQASVSTIGALLVGLPGAYLLSHYQFRGKRIIASIANIPFVLPSILVVLGFVVFYGNSGLLNKALMLLLKTDEPPLRVLYSFKAVILAHTFYNFPIALSLTAAYWEQLSSRDEQAAQSLGASPWTTFRTVTLPRLVPPLSAAASMIFLFCFTSFSIILVLGGGPQFTTLEVRIYQLARMQFDLQKAAAFAVFSLSVTLIVLITYIKSQFWMQSTLSSFHTTPEPKRTRTGTKVMIILYIVLIFFLAVMPLLSIAFRSLQAPSSRAGGTYFTLKWYQQLFDSGGTALFSTSSSAILNSLLIAVGVSAAAVPLAVSLSAVSVMMKRRGGMFTETLLMLPMAVSSVVIGLGYAILSTKLPDHIPAILLIGGAHLVITIPFLLRAVLPSHRKIHDTYYLASLSLGATPSTSFLHVEFPLLRNALLSGLMFVFAISLGEMHATILLADASVTTIPILLYRLIGSYNFYGACALGALLMTISAVLFIIAERLKKRYV
jgi:thiamine transport system permease protein